MTAAFLATGAISFMAGVFVASIILTARHEQENRMKVAKIGGVSYRLVPIGVEADTGGSNATS